MALSGRLEAFGLPELLQVLAQGKKTGVITVAGDESDGTLSLAHGRLVDASSGNLVGEDAVFSLLANNEGDFAFEADHGETVETASVTIERSLDALLIEASSRGLEAVSSQDDGGAV